MHNSYFRPSYDILNQVYREGSYLSILMKENSDRGTARLVYGVIEKHYELHYIIRTLAEKNVKPVVRTVLFLGIYSLKYLNTPLNVVLRYTDELLTDIGKSAVKEFAYAILKRVSEGDYAYPTKSSKDYLEVKYNMPSFLIGLLRKDYPDSFEEIIFAKPHTKVHIRRNSGTTEGEILAADKFAEPTATGYFVSNNKEISLLNFLGKICYMSYGSTLIAESIGVRRGEKLLDLCAAPGGKSVYLAEKGAEVTSVDIHPHRTDLIKAYAKRMGTVLTVKTADSTLPHSEWNERFDYVLIDAPCSGMGVLGKKRDALFHRTYEDILSLAELQKKLLTAGASYVKKGGLLIYATCTVLKKENSENIAWFLMQNERFQKEKIALPYENEGEVQWLPDGKGMEGFYLCHMRKG